MRVLILAPHAYLGSIKGFEKNRSGFSYTVGCIVEGLAKTEEVWLYTQSTFTPTINKDNLHIVKRGILDIFGKGFFKYFALWFNEGRVKNNPILSIRTLFYYLSACKVGKLINSIKPDIVNIRGVGFYTNSFIKATVNSKHKLIVSLHGLNNTSCDEQVRSIESETIDYLLKNSVTISVISTGIKRMLENRHDNSTRSKIYVINNGIDLSCWASDSMNVNSNIKHNNDKEIIYISSLSVNKNHIQLLRVFREIVKKNTACRLIIVGQGSEERKIREYVRNNELESNVVLCGQVDNCEVFSLLSRADLNVLVSIEEGFGRSIAEGYSCGTPALFFSDLYASDDLFNDKASIAVETRSDAALLRGLEEGLEKEWDKLFIKQFSKKFSKEVMMQKYLEMYRNENCQQ